MLLCRGTLHNKAGMFFERGAARERGRGRIGREMFLLTG